MKQFLASLGFMLFLTLNVIGQTLESVTTPDNTTTNAIWVTGFGNYSKNVDAVGLYYHLNKGYLDAMNPATAVFKPLVLRGSVIEMPARTLLNNGFDNGHSALSVHGEIRTDGIIRAGEGAQGYVTLNSASPGYVGFIAFHKGDDTRLGYIGSSQTEMMYVSENNASHVFLGGNVGVGTGATNYKLTVKGPVWASAAPGTFTSASIPNFYINSDDAGVSDFEVYTNTTATYMGPFLNKPLVFVRSGGTETMRIDASGNVGIGTSNPNGYKLAVAGTAIAQKVKVTAAATNWPDYVFHKEYVLPSLQDVAEYIAAHQHLPEIPSAIEIEKNGLDLGEMNKQLLKKIEELTLYLIQQQQETQALKARVKALEKK